MNQFKNFVFRISKGAIKAFQTFPMPIGCALLFTLATMVQIELSWSSTEGYSYFLTALRWALAFASLFGLPLIVAVKSRFDTKKAFITANFIGLAGAVIVFFALYQWGGIPSFSDSTIKVVSQLATSRLIVAMAVSFLMFIILLSYPKDQSDFARAFFMTHKAFFIALLYGGVIMAGSSLIVGALQVLILSEMPESIYAHLGIVCAFIGFSIFLGYFPDFRKGAADSQREIAQNQPRFVEVLFGYIMIPIFAALTLVLFGWAVKTIISGMNTSFTQLFGIAATYTLGGLWLYLMVTHDDTGIAKFYRRFYPIAALVILVFEAWALIQRIGDVGLRISEYYFIILWIVAAASSVLLLIKKIKAYLPIIYLICGLAVISVLPFMGYQPTTIASQTDRLTTLLIDENILQDGELVPATSSPELSVREDITDTVVYLASFPVAKLPSWFDPDMERSDIFKEKLGFEQSYGQIGGGDYFATSVFLPSLAIDISDYQQSLIFNTWSGAGDNVVTFEGKNGTYDIYWLIDQNNGIPTIKIVLNGEVIAEESLAPYVEQIVDQFPGDNGAQGTLEDMSLKIETEQLDALMVFQNIDGYIGPDEYNTYYNFSLNAVYLNEK
jgi:hypothetical protein